MENIKNYYVGISANEINGGEFYEFRHNVNHKAHPIEEKHRSFMANVVEVQWEEFSENFEQQGPFIREVGQIIGVDAIGKKLFVRFKDTQDGHMHMFVLK